MCEGFTDSVFCKNLFSSWNVCAVYLSWQKKLNMNNKVSDYITFLKQFYAAGKYGQKLLKHTVHWAKHAKESSYGFTANSLTLSNRSNNKCHVFPRANHFILGQIAMIQTFMFTVPGQTLKRFMG